MYMLGKSFPSYTASRSQLMVKGTNACQCVTTKLHEADVLPLNVVQALGLLTQLGDRSIGAQFHRLRVDDRILLTRRPVAFPPPIHHHAHVVRRVDQRLQDIRLVDDVAVGDDEIVVHDRLRAEERGHHVGGVVGGIVVLGHVGVRDRIFTVPGGDMKIVKSHLPGDVQLSFQKRCPLQRNHALGNVVRERPKPCSLPRGKHNQSHNVSSFSTRFRSSSVPACGDRFSHHIDAGVPSEASPSVLSLEGPTPVLSLVTPHPAYR